MNKEDERLNNNCYDTFCNECPFFKCDIICEVMNFQLVKCDRFHTFKEVLENLLKELEVLKNE